MALFVEETYIDLDRGVRYGMNEPYEVPSYMSRGDIYRESQANYGRCTGKVHQDRRERSGLNAQRWVVDDIGWVFLGRCTYDDHGTDKTYLREVWVVVTERNTDD